MWVVLRDQLVTMLTRFCPSGAESQGIRQSFWLSSSRRSGDPRWGIRLQDRPRHRSNALLQRRRAGYGAKLDEGDYESDDRSRLFWWAIRSLVAIVDSHSARLLHSGSHVVVQRRYDAARNRANDESSSPTAVSDLSRSSTEGTLRWDQSEYALAKGRRTTDGSVRRTETCSLAERRSWNGQRALSIEQVNQQASSSALLRSNSSFARFSHFALVDYSSPASDSSSEHLPFASLWCMYCLHHPDDASLTRRQCTGLPVAKFVPPLIRKRQSSTLLSPRYESLDDSPLRPSPYPTRREALWKIERDLRCGFLEVQGGCGW